MTLPILCFVPDGDKSSQYGSYFFHYFDVPHLIDQSGFEPVVLEGEMARFRPFARALEKHDPPVIFTVGGHGAWNLLSGQDKEPIAAIPGVAKELPGKEFIVVKRGNDELFKNRAVYTISCHVSRGLGRKAVADGCITFAGYRRSFVWLVDADGVPDEDDTAKPFFDAGFEFMRSLLDGKTFAQAQDDTVEAFGRKAHETDDEDEKRYLLWNARILEVIGHPNLKLADFHEIPAVAR